MSFFNYFNPTSGFDSPTLASNQCDWERSHTPLLAAGQLIDSDEMLHSYEDLFFAALRRKATRKRHTNVLLHVMGYFKKRLDAQDKQELLESIEDSRRELVPLVIPLTLIRHHLKKLGQDYIASQIYLNPHPKELMLLNHV